jgi:hypothetical protein
VYATILLGTLYVLSGVRVKVHEAIILPVVVNVCYTWYVVLMEEHNSDCLRRSAGRNVGT